MDKLETIETALYALMDGDVNEEYNLVTTY